MRSVYGELVTLVLLHIESDL